MSNDELSLQNFIMSLDDLRKLHQENTNNNILEILDYYDHIKNGIVQNSNFTFDKLFSFIEKYDRPETVSHLWIEMSLFMETHSLEGIEELLWTQATSYYQRMGSGFSLSNVGYRIIQNTKKSALIDEIIKYHLNMKGTTIKNSNGIEIPNPDYGAFLEYMIEYEQKYDAIERYIELYKEFDALKKGPYFWPEYFPLLALSKNKNLNEEKIDELYQKIIKQEIPDELKVGILSRLIESENISESLFQTIFNYKKMIKDKQEIIWMYNSAARNKRHIMKSFDLLYKYIEKGLVNRGQRSNVLSSLLKNTNVNQGMLEKLAVIIIGMENDASYSEYGFKKVHNFISNAVSRDDIPIDMTINLIKCYFRILKAYENKSNKGSLDNVMKNCDLFNNIKLDKEIFSLIVDLSKGSAYENNILGSIIINNKLTKEQYDIIICTIKNHFFNASNEIILEYPHPRAYNYTKGRILENWASCKFVK